MFARGPALPYRLVPRRQGQFPGLLISFARPTKRFLQARLKCIWVVLSILMPSLVNNVDSTNVKKAVEMDQSFDKASLYHFLLSALRSLISATVMIGSLVEPWFVVMKTFR